MFEQKLVIIFLFKHNISVIHLTHTRTIKHLITHFANFEKFQTIEKKQGYAFHVCIY